MGRRIGRRRAGWPAVIEAATGRLLAGWCCLLSWQGACQRACRRRIADQRLVEGVLRAQGLHHPPLPQPPRSGPDIGADPCCEPE